MSKEIFDALFEVLESRRVADPNKSYTAKLFRQGLATINEKILEEAGELTEAAERKEQREIIHEACDLLFHLFVLCAYKDISLGDLRAELERRFGISGIEEKRHR